MPAPLVAILGALSTGATLAGLVSPEPRKARLRELTGWLRAASAQRRTARTPDEVARAERRLAACIAGLDELAERL
jgi:hypothetical protein